MTAKSWVATVNSLILIAVLFAAWQLLFEFAGSQAMTAPVETFRYLAHLLTTAAFWGHVEETSRAFFFALLLAVLLGLIIGFLLGVHRFSSEVFEPVLVAFYSVPKITLYPIILLAFGLGLPAKIAFGTIHGVVPVAIFTMGAVRSLNPILLKTARVLRLRPQELVGSVLLPAALPEIFTGIRLGFCADLDRHIARRNVRFATRARLSADDRDRLAERATDHGGDVADRAVRRFGQYAAHRHRP